ncbi:VOC family protein [Ekhidna sp.]|uniref:VOC family protein n=1 Tax=Ekhidna sp. TaxID=2608089 RepID=UPI003299CB5D
MNTIIPYLVFPGVCKEAMTYYASIFEGEITTMITFKESPVPVPDTAGDRIYNSELKVGNLVIKASDDIPGYEVTPGSNFSLYLPFESVEKKKFVFGKLCEEGKMLFPIEDNFGMCKDKYGIQWMVVTER